MRKKLNKPFFLGHCPAQAPSLHPRLGQGPHYNVSASMHMYRYAHHRLAALRMVQALHWRDLLWAKCRIWDHTHPKLFGSALSLAPPLFLPVQEQRLLEHTYTYHTSTNGYRTSLGDISMCEVHVDKNKYVSMHVF